MKHSNRRAFFGLILGAISAVSILGSRLASNLGGFGLVTVERWASLGMQRTHRVFLNDVDITNGCCRFNDREGWAEVLRRDQQGNFFVEYMRPDGSIFIPDPADYHTEESLKWDARVAKQIIYGKVSVRKSDEHE